MAECLRGRPGAWRTDERGIELTPVEVLRRCSYEFRGEFQEMLDFRASYDPAWRAWATRPK
jgi:hypothetical protein